MGGRVMGISTAYLNEPVIAGHLKKQRHRRTPKFSTILWISCSKMARVPAAPLDVVDKLHKLDEKHYTYEMPGDGDYLAYSSVHRRYFYALFNNTTALC
ncbi:hypothetical protein OAZ24_00045 [Synechococcus sp. AH-736-G21]|nr:hypothetical protein [Synechococcus sp. AH-736-G21]